MKPIPRSLLVAALAAFILAVAAVFVYRNLMGGGGAALADTRWTLVALRGTPPLAGTAVTLTFTGDGRLGGNASCNSYGGDYEVEGDRLEFGEMATTAMACVDQAANDQEAQYMQALSQVETFAIQGDQLLLEDASGQTVLVFQRE